MAKYRTRYELAEEILRNGGSNEEIQRRIMKEFDGSKENTTRANWYRRSWNKYGHCRGDSKTKRQSSSQSAADGNLKSWPSMALLDVDSVLDELEKKWANRNDVYLAKLVRRLIRNDRAFVNALKTKYGHRCQFPACKAEIPVADGGFYCEVAHVQPVSRGGGATRVNLVVLCPNHHKMIDCGNLTVDSATRQEIVGSLNGKRFRIGR